MGEYKRVLVGKTSISVSGIDIDVDIVRNEAGNLEVQGYMEYFPNGTLIEGRNDEIEFHGFELGKKYVDGKEIDVNPEEVLSKIREKVENNKTKSKLIERVDALENEIGLLKKELNVGDNLIKIGSKIYHKDYGHNTVIDINDTNIFLKTEWTHKITNLHHRTFKSFAKNSYVGETLTVL